MSQLLDASQADDAPEGLVIRDARGEVFEKLGAEIWGSTRWEWGAVGSDLAFPAAILYSPEGS